MEVTWSVFRKENYLIQRTSGAQRDADLGRFRISVTLANPFHRPETNPVQLVRIVVTVVKLTNAVVEDCFYKML